MPRRSKKDTIKVRTGTATTDRGQATVEHILNAARDVLMTEGAGEFSMRNIAARAEVRLNNVQYYFPKRDDLVLALITHIGNEYERNYNEMLNGASTDPLERFKAVVRYNLRDGFNPATRQLFIQLWAILSALDLNTGRLLGKLYDINVAQLSASLAKLHPNESEADIRHRATLVTAITEGLMIVRGPPASKAREKRLAEHAYTMAMNVAIRDSLDPLDAPALSTLLGF